jgi:hypothetical protein
MNNYRSNAGDAMNTTIFNETALKIQARRRKMKKAGNSPEKEKHQPEKKDQGTKRQSLHKPKEQGNQPETVTENNFRMLDQGHAEKTTGEAPQEVPIAEEPHGKSTPETREMSVPEREEEQGKTAAGKDIGPDVEEGEVSSDSDYEGTSDTIVTPKKIGRGRKSKKEEREKETYKDVLSGSQPTIRQLINVRQTRKHSRVPQGAHTSPPGKS